MKREKERESETLVRHLIPRNSGVDPVDYLTLRDKEHPRFLSLSMPIDILRPWNYLGGLATLCGPSVKQLRIKTLLELGFRINPNVLTTLKPGCLNPGFGVVFRHDRGLTWNLGLKKGTLG